MTGAWKATYATNAGMIKRYFRDQPDDREIQAADEYATATRVDVEPVSLTEYIGRFDRIRVFSFRKLVEQ